MPNVENLDLFCCMSKLSNREMEDFFLDLCTSKEIRAMRERWRLCQILFRGDLSYREIKSMTGSSLTTIGRVAKSLNEDKTNGYKKLLEIVMDETAI